jgi:hypothetical protein
MLLCVRMRVFIGAPNAFPMRRAISDGSGG